VQIETIEDEITSEKLHFRIDNFGIL